MLSIKTTKFLLLFLLLSIVWSPYISSWFPKVNGLPLGPVLRDMAIFVFYFMFFISFLTRRKIKLKSHFHITTIFFVLLLVPIISDKSTILQIILGLHAFLFYPFLFTFLYNYYMNFPKREFWCNVTAFVASILTCLFFVMSSISIIDVFTGGTFTLLLGYNPNYGGDGFELITRYYNLVRANGGFADALAFGYLMALGSIFFVYRMRYKFDKSNIINVMGLFLTSLATVLSITRGAIIALVIIFAIYLYKCRAWVWVTCSCLSLLIIICISLSDYSDVFMGRFTDSDKGSKASTSQRYEMALKSIDYLTENPMGVGLGTQGAGSTLTNHDERVNTDNFIFHSVLELGIINGTLFLIFILSQFNIIYKNTQGRRELFFSLFSLYFISAAFSSSLQSGTLSVIFWIVAFIIVIDGRMKDSRNAFKL